METELNRQQEIVREIASQCEQDHQQMIKQDRSLRKESHTLTENEVRINGDQADKNGSSIKKKLHPILWADRGKP